MLRRNDAFAGGGDMLRVIRYWMFAAVLAVFGGSGWCASAEGVFVEAEGLGDLGGWVLDQQAIEQMGSAYVLAHGLGVPVEDCEGEVIFPSTGRYYLWVRTRDWVAPWNAEGAPGRFHVVVDGKVVPVVFGTKGAEWDWHSGGAVEISAKKVRVGLHDLTGFEGRCDAIFFAKDGSFVPPSDKEGLGAFRRKMLGLGDGYEDAGEFDIVVVGGGMAGTCTAISAARLGLEVALIQNRAVLGGNNSSEVRVHLNGEINLPPYPALGDVVRELDSGFRGNAQPAGHYDDEKKLRVVRAEERIHLFLNTHVLSVEKEGDRIAAVIGRELRTSREMRFRGRLFVDCTGDATVGYLAGADYRMGRESRNETGESLAPQKADKMTMGMSVQWYSVEEEEATSFGDCPWAMQFTDQTCQPVMRGDWDWEAGMNRNQVTESEYIRDHSLRVIYGNWAFMKNHSVQKDKYARRGLGWVAYIGGKRESRRLMGDLVLCQQDIQQDTIFDDAFVTATWRIDLHYPNPQNTRHFPENEFRSIAEYGEKNPYPVPYRCLYSRNVGNLMMAGRNISVTHVALGTTRVMRTCGMMGELVGMAASLCKKHDCLPRDVYEDHLDELKALATKGVGKFAYKPVKAGANERGVADVPHFRAKLQAGDSVLIVAFGDSVTKGSMENGRCDFVSVYHNQLKRILEERYKTKVFNVINAGIDGDDSFNGLKRFEHDALLFEPDLILIELGLNDCAGRGPEGLEAFKSNVQAMIDAAKKSGPADIVLLTPNFMATGDNAHVCDEHRKLNYPALMSQRQNTGVLGSYAQVLRQLGQANRVAVADVYAGWETLAKTVDTNTLLINGLNHPNAAGHLLAAETIARLWEAEPHNIEGVSKDSAP